MNIYITNLDPTSRFLYKGYIPACDIYHNRIFLENEVSSTGYWLYINVGDDIIKAFLLSDFIKLQSEKISKLERVLYGIE